MVKIAIVSHSGYGHTYEVAKHVKVGVEKAGCTASHYTASEAIEKMAELQDFDGIIFGSPTYMGSASADFKKFMDASSKEWAQQKWHNKIAAGFTNSSSMSGDKLSTLIQISIFAAQHGMIWVGNDILPNTSGKSPNPDGMNRLGSWLGLMTQANSDEGPDIAPPQSDRKTAEHFGKRVAEITIKFVGGK